MDPAAQPGASQQGPPPGVTFGAPVAPPVTPAVAQPVAPPPGVTFGAPVQQPAMSSPLIVNPKNEGTYKMAGPDGTGDASIPYSNVPAAMKAGYGITDPAEQQRFMKDRNADPDQSTLKDLADVLIRQPAHALKEGAKGLLKNEAQVPVTIAGWLDNMESHLNRMDEAVSGQSNKTPEDLIANRDPNAFHGASQHVKDFLEAHAPGITSAPIGTAQERGATVGTLGEFGAGEAGLAQLTKTLPWLVEGGNYAEKLKAVQPLLDAAKAHPRIAATLLAGAESGTVGAGQAALHGASPTDAAIAGAETGAAGLLTRGAGEGFANAREAAVAREAAAAAHEGAPAVLAERTAAMNAERQAAAQGGVKGVVSTALQDAADRFNKLGQNVEGFTPIDASKGAGTFGEASEQLKEGARPIYKALDANEAYGGKLQELQDAFTKANDNFDYKAADAAEIQMDDLLAKKPADVDPRQYAAAKSAWSDAKVLDKLHSATEGAFNGISEERAAAEGSARMLSGGNNQGGGTLSKRLGNIMKTAKDQANVERVIGKEGVANLDRASRLVSTPELRAQTQALAEAVAKEFPAPAEEHPVARAIKDSALGAAAGGALNYVTGGHLPGSVAAEIGAAGTNGARYVLRKMVMSPRIGTLMDYAVRNNVSPKIAAGLVAAEIRKEQPATPEATQ